MIVFRHRLTSREIEPDFPELFRYAGFSKEILQGEKISDSQMEELAKSAAKDISEKMNCRSVYAKFPLELGAEEKIRFARKEIQSHHLSVNLKNCHSVILFAATLGPEVDRLIQKNSKINPAKSVMLQAAGAMFIERYVDMLQDFFKSEEAKNKNAIRPRFSPGYGDVSLEVQKIFFELLDCQKNLALTLNDSLIMSPEKSVTAFVGIYEDLEKFQTR